MEGRLFTLVNTADESEVFAWGMEISSDAEREAVTYIKDPHSGQILFGVHASAEAAERRYHTRLVWES